jgi:hypothetical protein
MTLTGKLNFNRIGVKMKIMILMMDLIGQLKRVILIKKMVVNRSKETVNFTMLPDNLSTQTTEWPMITMQN